MAVTMNAPSPPATSVPVDFAIASEGRRPTTSLDLDTMARIAEEAGRDALLERGAHASFDAAPLRVVPTDDAMLLTATRLYGACLRGATDPATD